MDWVDIYGYVNVDPAVLDLLNKDTYAARWCRTKVDRDMIMVHVREDNTMPSQTRSTTAQHDSPELEQKMQTPVSCFVLLGEKLKPIDRSERELEQIALIVFQSNVQHYLWLLCIYISGNEGEVGLPSLPRAEGRM